MTPKSIRAHLHPDRPGVGSIEDGTVDEIARAEDWLRDQGCTRAQGPMGVDTWHPYRATLGPHERPPFLGEPLFDADPWQARGYHIVERYASTLADNLKQAESAAERSCALLGAGWDAVPLSELGRFEDALRIFHGIATAAFSEAFAYTPLAWETFQDMYAPIEALIDPTLVRTAISPDGDPAGFCFSIPDRLNPDRKEFIVKTLAVDPKYRQLGLGSWLVGVCHSAAHAAGWTGGGIHALMWADSHSRAISKHGGTVFREYALFEKDLTG